MRFSGGIYCRTHQAHLKCRSAAMCMSAGERYGEQANGWFIDGLWRRPSKNIQAPVQNSLAVATITAHHHKDTVIRLPGGLGQALDTT